MNIRSYRNYFDGDISIRQKDIFKYIRLPIVEHRKQLTLGMCHALSINWLISLQEGYTIKSACQKLTGKLHDQNENQIISLHQQLIYQQISMQQRQKMTPNSFNDDILISDCSRGKLRCHKTLRITSIDPTELGNNIDDILCYNNLYLVIMSPVNHCVAIGRDATGHAGLFDANYGVIKIIQYESLRDIINSMCRHYRPCSELHVQAYSIR